MDNKPSNQTGPRPSNRPVRSNNNPNNNQPKAKTSAGQGRNPRANRGAAIRAQRRTQDDAHRIANKYLDASGQQSEGQPRANFIDDSPRLKIIGLG
ncbi:MAG: hypothetical protein WCK69_01580, partial [Candidatus Saccharibacteria bacterium]